MASVLTQAVTPIVLTADMDFATVLGHFTSGKVSPEAFAAWQAAASAPAASPAKSNGAGARKTVPTLTRAEFLATAKALDVVINGIPTMAESKQFSTGSLGWGANGKVQVKVGDKLVTCQLSLNVTVVGSKELA